MSGCRIYHHQKNLSLDIYLSHDIFDFDFCIDPEELHDFLFETSGDKGVIFLLCRLVGTVFGLVEIQNSDYGMEIV